MISKHILDAARAGLIVWVAAVGWGLAAAEPDADLVRQAEEYLAEKSPAAAGEKLQALREQGEAATNAVREAAGWGWVVPADFQDFAGLVRELVPGEPAPTDPQLNALWDRLPGTAQGPLLELKESRRAPTEADQWALADGLNQLLAADGAELDPGLQNRLKSAPRRPPAASDLVWSRAVDFWAAQADTLARQLLVVCGMPGFAGAKRHVAKLAELNDPRAGRQLFAYLTSPEGGVRASAREALAEKIRRRPDEMAVRFADEIGRLSLMPAGKLEFEPTVNLFRAALAFGPNEAGRLLEPALKANRPELRRAALTALAGRPELLGQVGVRLALETYLTNEWQNEAAVLEVLNLIRRAKEKETLKLAAAGLKHHNRRIALAATETLADLTGQKFGPNPAAWEAWLAGRK